MADWLVEHERNTNSKWNNQSKLVPFRLLISWILKQSIECKYSIAEESETTKRGEFMGLLLNY